MGAAGPLHRETASQPLIRLSAGIEPLQAIVADIDNAMKVS